MSKTDEFIEKIEQLDPHLKVQKYDSVDGYDYEKVEMIVWYETPNDWKQSFVTFVYCGGSLMVKTDLNRFAEASLVLYSKVIKLCADYFPFLYKEG